MQDGGTGSQKSPAFRECGPGQLRREVEVEEEEVNGMHLGGEWGGPAGAETTTVTQEARRASPGEQPRLML